MTAVFGHLMSCCAKSSPRWGRMEWHLPELSVPPTVAEVAGQIAHSCGLGLQNTAILIQGVLPACSQKIPLPDFADRHGKALTSVERNATHPCHKVLPTCKHVVAAIC